MLYEHAILYQDQSMITSTGALSVLSGSKTGRSPKDKRIVYEPTTCTDVWWGSVNMKMSDHSFTISRQRAVDYLNAQPRTYVVNAFAGWDSRYRIKVRCICSLPYHALFMKNMLIRPTKEELEQFGEPDYVIYNAGAIPANEYGDGATSSTSICLSFERKEVIILGTMYAGEMKKIVLTIMMYLMPKMNCLPMHSSCTEGTDGSVTVFFGLSGTGKSSLSMSDPKRKLIGDDEHVWTEDGSVFNIEGGCYAKTIKLLRENEPEVFDAIRFGAVLENVVVDPLTRKVDYNDISITENTRCAFPIDHIAHSKIPCVAGRPTAIVMLSADAFGILPPVAKLNFHQAMYHFVSGYTAKIAGTEVGVKEPTATFSACFGEPFLVWHPLKYAQMLADKMKEYDVPCYLVNTGWVGGGYGVGSRIPIQYSRAIVDAINNGSIEQCEFYMDPIFGFMIPKTVEGVPSLILSPRMSWADADKYDRTAMDLAGMFVKNMQRFEIPPENELLKGGPLQANMQVIWNPEGGIVG
jgi:phosphoenolpyruvate carboxykinase (ATP)